MPINVIEDMQADAMAQDKGWVDAKTLGEKYVKRYGVDWDTIQANMAEMKKADNENNDNVGAMILRNFRNGQMNQPVNGQDNQGREAESE
jgi:hypothetical protein